MENGTAALRAVWLESRRYDPRPERCEEDDGAPALRRRGRATTGSRRNASLSPLPSAGDHRPGQRLRGTACQSGFPAPVPISPIYNSIPSVTLRSPAAGLRASKTVFFRVDTVDRRARAALLCRSPISLVGRLSGTPASESRVARKRSAQANPVRRSCLGRRNRRGPKLHERSASRE